ncbi:FK506-binding protein 1B [Aspergillus turcosus]|uniref:peptidylprolyl isomerase n=1 Tax=Aspergillus turcosus TaxID=1245748 RepID=A0A229X557_9EURO|nr:FK506-binding protein 1B [Aspergillus turcosus]RLL95339.1 FK506-binding protein 1B [Aspergillus turcosus]
MGLEKQTLRTGNGKDRPQPGDPVELNYTGYLYDESNPDYHKGKEFDSSKRRGPLKATIGTGDVIRGWDEGVPQMSLGEKAILTMSGYGFLPLALLPLLLGL